MYIHTYCTHTHRVSSCTFTQAEALAPANSNRLEHSMATCSCWFNRQQQRALGSLRHVDVSKLPAPSGKRLHNYGKSPCY